MILHLTPTQVLAAVGVVLALVLVWRASSRATKRAAETARSGARLMSLAGRVVTTAALITGVQWIVVLYQGSTTLLLVVLGLPALIAAYTLTRALTVSTSEMPRSRGGRR